MKQHFFLIALCLLFTSCGGEENESSQSVGEDDFLEANVENSLAQILTCDGFTEIIEWEHSPFITSGDAYKWVRVTGSSSNPYPRKIAVEYKERTPTDKQDILRKGKITGNLDSTIRKVGSKLTISYIYSANDVQLSGTQTFVTQRAEVRNDSLVLLEVKVVMERATLQDLSKSHTHLAYFSTEQTWVWKPQSISISINGTTSGKTHSYKSYTSYVEQALVKKTDCHYLVDGVTQLYMSGDTATVNFNVADARGECNPFAHFSYAGKSRTELFEY